MGRMRVANELDSPVHALLESGAWSIVTLVLKTNPIESAPHGILRCVRA
jgi:hypothetical protein